MYSLNHIFETYLKLCVVCIHVQHGQVCTHCVRACVCTHVYACTCVHVHAPEFNVLVHPSPLLFRETKSLSEREVHGFS